MYFFKFSITAECPLDIMPIRGNQECFVGIRLEMLNPICCPFKMLYVLTLKRFINKLFYLVQ